jgi:hypothetical protein
VKDFIPLTFDYSTARIAHQVLKYIVEIQCVLGKSSYYGLPLIDKEFLLVANSTETEFLEQAELKAIKERLEYKEMSGEGFSYRGYSKDGKAEGPGILITKDKKLTGEWH